MATLPTSLSCAVQLRGDDPPRSARRTNSQPGVYSAVLAPAARRPRPVPGLLPRIRPRRLVLPRELALPRAAPRNRRGRRCRPEARRGRRSAGGWADTADSGDRAVLAHAQRDRSRRQVERPLLKPRSDRSALLCAHARSEVASRAAASRLPVPLSWPRYGRTAPSRLDRYHPDSPTFCTFWPGTG